MSQLLRKALSDELLRRHGYRTMEAKIKPVHIANALMRVEHQCVGRMSVLEQLFVATYKKNSTEQRVAAVQAMITGQKERWGALVHCVIELAPAECAVTGRRTST